jgi:hypothetical protein
MDSELRQFKSDIDLRALVACLIEQKRFVVAAIGYANDARVPALILA